MNLPNNFKKIISREFYDKQLQIYSIGTIKDNEGGIIGTGKQSLIEEMQGNFQFKTREKIQQEYGQEIVAEAIVTCSEITATIGNILVYQNTDYEIKSIIPSETHYTLLLHKK